MKTMVIVKDIVLTAIKYRGLEQVKKESKKLAENCLCSESYVRSIIRMVEKDKITIN